MSTDTDESARKAAARWYAELQDAEADPLLWQRFLIWERDPVNAAAFRQIEAALSTLDRTRYASHGVRGEEQRRAVWPWAAGIAAAVLMAFGGTVALRGSNAPLAAPEVYATLIGEQETVTLPDGSTVLLNTASRIQVMYSAEARRVALSDGQALFEVEKGATPFIVEAGGSQTTALGTAFEVYLPAEGVRVTLIEGSVNVFAAGEDTLLVPGDQLSLAGQGRSVTRVDPGRALSWQSGMITFMDVTLAEAAAEMNRYSETKVQIEGRVAEERLSGVFRAGDQEGFVAALEGVLSVDAEQRGGKYVVSATQAN